MYSVCMWYSCGACIHTCVQVETGPHTELGAHGLDKAAGLVRSKDPIVSASGELGL